MRIVKLLLAVMVGIAGTVPGPAAAADLVMVDVSEPGVCGSDKVLGTISKRFRHQVTHVPHLPQVDILDYWNVRETRHLPQAEDRPIDRRYCHARAALSDGGNRDIWYLIERPMGFAGIGSNVEFCVAGFDRWNVYGGHCRVLR
jgi:hypothetical protein